MANARNVTDAILWSRLPKMMKAEFQVSAYLAAMHGGHITTRPTEYPITGEVRHG
jgi:hypothetical protein